MSQWLGIILQLLIAAGAVWYVLTAVRGAQREVQPPDAPTSDAPSDAQFQLQLSQVKDVARDARKRAEDAARAASEARQALDALAGSAALPSASQAQATGSVSREDLARETAALRELLEQVRAVSNAARAQAEAADRQLLDMKERLNVLRDMLDKPEDRTEGLFAVWIATIIEKHRGEIRALETMSEPVREIEGLDVRAFCDQMNLIARLVDPEQGLVPLDLFLTNWGITVARIGGILRGYIALWRREARRPDALKDLEWLIRRCQEHAAE